MRAFNGGVFIERYLWQSRRILKALGDMVHKALTDAGLSLPPFDGGFYAFPDFSPLREQLARRDITTSRQLCTRLLEDTGLATLPGDCFGRPVTELSVRLAYVDFDGARALAAAEQMPGDQPLATDFMQQNCEKMTTAMERLCGWLKA